MILSTIKKIGILLTSIVYFNLSAQVFQTMKHLPGTGQTKSYTSTFGENADYPLLNPFFIANANKTVTDTVTGLVWQATDGGEMTFAQAKNYCDTLSLAGFTDWRLPNAHEAFSIFSHDFTNPALNIGFFTKTAAEYWWSSTQQVGDPSKVWCTNAGGGIGNHPIAETISAGGNKKFHVRAVRDVQTPKLIQSQFVSINQMVYDSLTQLYWMPVLSSDTLTWEQALTYAEQLSWSGFSDWRLPNIKELQSINLESKSNPSLSSSVFPQIGIKTIWSSTSLPNQTTKAWYLDTKFGITTYQFKTNRLWVMCVRGGFNAPSNAVNTVTFEPTVIIYPNPCQSDFNVHSNELINSIAVYNSLGVLVLEQAVNDYSITLKGFQSGLYHLVVNQLGHQSFKTVSIN